MLVGSKEGKRIDEYQQSSSGAPWKSKERARLIMFPIFNEIYVIFKGVSVMSLGILCSGLLTVFLISLATRLRHRFRLHDRQRRNPTMGELPRSSRKTHEDDMGRDEEAIEGVTTSPPVPLPAFGTPVSACDVLRPLSQLTWQWPGPMPSSGSVAALMKEKNQQKAISSSNSMHDRWLQSESHMNAMIDSLGSDDIVEVKVSALRPASNHLQAEASSAVKSLRSTSGCNDDGTFDIQKLPAPYTSMPPKGLDQYPTLMHDYDHVESQEQEYIQRRSETMQLYCRKDEDNDRIWRRRVINYS